MQRICLTMKFDLWIGSRALYFSQRHFKGEVWIQPWPLIYKVGSRSMNTVQPAAIPTGSIGELSSRHRFLYVVFFLHLDIWSRKLIQSHCTPSTYGHFINKDWVWLSHKGKEIYAPKKWNLCKLWSKFTMKPAYHCQFCFCCIGCGAPDKSFGLYLFHTLSTGAQICWNFVNWLVHVYWNRHWLAKILNLHARIETFLSLIQHVN